MRRAMLTAGLLLATLTGTSPAFDDYYYDDGGWDDGYYDDGGWDDGGWGGQRRSRGNFLPYTPGNQNSAPNWYTPNTPGVQNNLGWDNNGWNNNGWNNNGWNNGHQHQQNWNYQPQQSWSQNTQPQYQVRPAVVYSQQPIKISMPDNEAGLCAYVLKDTSNSWNYTIAPGKSQEFKEDRAWKITFDRGNGHGEQTYGLKPGFYRFRQSSRGWELYHSSADAAVAPVTLAPPAPM